MSNDILNYKKVYDDTYNSINNYNYYDEVKNVYVDAYAIFVEGKMLDAGCGEGIHFKRLINKGYDVFGIELSEVCCNKYLQGLPYQNIDIVSFAKQGQQFAGIICMDVLEHVPYDAIDETIKVLSLMSPSVFLGIANHSDIINSVELHLIQEDSSWWVNLLKKYYKDVVMLTELYEGRFFFIQCDNNSNSNNKYTYKVMQEIGSLQKKRTSEQEMFKREKTRLEQEKACLEQEKACLEQEKACLEQEKVVLYNRYKYIEKFRVSPIGKRLINIKRKIQGVY